MMRAWARLHQAPFWIRWPVKWLIFAAVTFVVLYPDPRLFVRTVRHGRMMDQLSDPSSPTLAPVLSEFEDFLAEQEKTEVAGRPLLQEVERFVLRRIPYAFDWQVWGVVDYLPRLEELLAQGREDCDGRAVLAAAILRARGVDAHLVGDPRHLWVATPDGELMGPLDEPVFRATPAGLQIRWARLLDPGPLAVGIALFPMSRELIILACAWILLLWPGCTGLQGGLLLLLLGDALVVTRLAGRNVHEPSYFGIIWAGLHLAAAIFLAFRWARHEKRADRSVCLSETV